MNDLLFEAKPRWKDGPMICLATNRPSFVNRVTLIQFIELNCPGAREVRIGKCCVCGQYHFACKHRGPSGDSSGSSRR